MFIKNFIYLVWLSFRTCSSNEFHQSIMSKFRLVFWVWMIDGWKVNWWCDMGIGLSVDNTWRDDKTWRVVFFHTLSVFVRFIRQLKLNFCFPVPGTEMFAVGYDLLFCSKSVFPKTFLLIIGQWGISRRISFGIWKIWVLTVFQFVFEII